jgi:hypothetical protein
MCAAPRSGRGSNRCVRRQVQRQARQGGRLSDQGPGRAARLLRLPRRADHLRMSNPIESVFATVRHRTVRTKGALSAKTATLMVFKLVNAGAKNMTTIEGRKSVAESRPRRDVVIGGGNVKKLKKLLLGCRAGHNNNAFLGGFRLEPREAHVPEANHKPSELMPHSHSAARSQFCRLRR